MSYDLSSEIILFLPLLSFLLLSIFGKRIKPEISGIIGTMVLAITAILSLYVAFGYFFDFGKVDGVYVKHIVTQFSWLRFNENLSINMGIVLDPISPYAFRSITNITCSRFRFGRSEAGTWSGPER